MEYQQVINTMSPEVYQNLKRALEMGKWPDGRPLTRQQRDETMQAVIAWGERHLPENERVGYIDKGHKAGEICDDPQAITLNWKE
ncbi:MAG: DUF1315 family protein [Halioglobus sp.]